MVRQVVLAREVPLLATGFSAYRFMIPVAELEKETEFVKVIKPLDPQTATVVSYVRRLIIDPARHASIFGVVALVPNEDMKESAENTSWVIHGSQEKMVEAFDVFPEWAKQQLRLAEDAGLGSCETWTFCRRGIGQGS